MTEPVAAREPEPRPEAPPAVALPAAPRWAVIGIFLMLLIGGMACARSFLMPVVMAFRLALVFAPVRRSLGRVGVPAGAAATC